MKLKYTFLYISLLLITLGCSKKKETTNPGVIATVSTVSVSSITTNSAQSGCIVSADGGSAVSENGVCFNTSPNPTINNSFKSISSGTGTFETTVNGLLENTTYYLKAYATNSVGTSYGEEVSFTTSSGPQLLLNNGSTPKSLFDAGTPLTDIYGLTYQGGYIFYLNTATGTGMVAAPSDFETEAVWGCYGTLLTGANATAIGSGAQNTIDLVTECTETGIAAALCANFISSEYSDWFLPSRDELSAMYTNLKSNGHGNFTTGLYWCSTQGTNNNCWYKNFNNGNQSVTYKNYSYKVRAARSF